MMTATAMRVLMTITTRNDGAGDSDDLFGLNWWMPGFPQPAALTRREAKCLCAKRNAHRQSPKKTLPRQALTLSPTMPNAPEAAPDLRFALPGGTPLSPRPACASTLLRGNVRPGRTPDLRSLNRRRTGIEWRSSRARAHRESLNFLNCKPPCQTFRQRLEYVPPCWWEVCTNVCVGNSGRHRACCRSGCTMGSAALGSTPRWGGALHRDNGRNTSRS